MSLLYSACHTEYYLSVVHNVTTTHYTAHATLSIILVLYTMSLLHSAYHTEYYLSVVHNVTTIQRMPH